MRSKGKRTTARAAGRPGLPIVLVMAAVISPLPVAAAPAGEPSPGEGAPQVACGEPAISTAPAMVPCDNGGEGASSCETKGTISVGGVGSVSGCGISCADGWYACCQNATIAHRAACSCRQEQPRGPWTPETPW